MSEEVQDPETPELDEELQKEVITKIRTHNQKGKWNRMAEVQNSRDQRLYFRSIQQFYWNEDTQDVVFESDDDSPYDRTFNVYQGYGKIFQSTFMGAKPKVRAEADDPFDDASIRAAAKAKVYERVYRKHNDIGDTQLEMSRLMWTDGRIVTQTINEDGVEKTRFHGVLESRLPINAKSLQECTLIELEDEYPIAQKKRQYPDARKKLSSGSGDSYERNARIAVKRQAGTDTSIDVMSGEDAYGLVTITTSIMRPDFYEEFSEAVREQLEQMYPEGLCVVRSGDLCLESYAYNPDKYLDVLHAMPGDGMSRPSIGATMMPLQDSINTGMNLTEEMFDHGIPTTYYDTKTDIDGLNKTREMPGASRKATGIPGQALGSAFFQTAMVNPPASLMEYMELLRGPLAQFTTGQQPALFGGQMEDQKTASGYAQARTMALGQMAIVWKPFTSWYARETTRAVKLASEQLNEITANLSPASPGGKPESVRIQPGELSGASFTNESDENFPETFTERGNKLMNIMQVAGPLADGLLDEPDNLYLLKQVWGIDDLVIPGEDIRNNVLADIAQMEHELPVPDPSQMPAQPLPAMGAPPVQVPKISSIKIDTDYLDEKDLGIGFKEVKRWINSAAGREAKVSNPAWFENVSLYGMQYKNAMPPPPSPPEPPPGLTIPYDSLPVSGKLQAAEQRGIQLTPADIASVPPKTLPGAAPNA